MFRFIWLFIKTVLSATLLLLAFIMLSAIFRFGWGGGIFVGLLALILIAMAIVPWLFSRPEKKKVIEKEKRPFLPSSIFILQEPESLRDKAILATLSAAFFSYMLFCSYWSFINLFSSFSTPSVTTGIVKSIDNKRNNHVLVLKTEDGEVRFNNGCSTKDLGPGSKILVGSRDSQRNPFDGLRRTIFIQKDGVTVCSSSLADPERWQAIKFLDAIITIAILGLLAFAADLLLISLGLKSKLKVLLGLESEKRTP